MRLIKSPTLYRQDHLNQVLGTFGIILFLNEAVKFIWGAEPLSVPMPDSLSNAIALPGGISYPLYRLVIIVVGLVVGLLLHLVINHTRIGMLVRAGATNAPMAGALGVNTGLLFSGVFGAGAMLAGLAGAMVAPILSVEPGMGDNVLILAFVVVIVGGIGSIRGAFVAALIVGIVDTLGRFVVPAGLRIVFQPATAAQAGSALSPMLIYIIMAAVLFFRPSGLFSTKARA